MMRIFRRVTFAVFSLAYLVVCPLTVLHAFGYSFRPGEGRTLVKTGLIYLSTTPSGATVYLGNRRYTQRTPTMLSGLIPGQYTLRLSMKNYRTWERVLPVAPEKATALENILLLPAQLPTEERYSEPLTGLVNLPGTRFILISTGPLLGDVFVYDWKDDKTWPLLDAYSPWRMGKVVETQVSDEGPHVLFQVGQSGQLYTLWVEVRRAEASVIDLTKTLLDAPEMLYWNPSMHRYLFSFQQGWINRIDLEERAVSPQWIGGLLGLGVSGRNLYVLRSDGECWRVDREGKEEELLGKVPLPSPPALGRASRFRIYGLTSSLLLLVGDRGELLTTRAPRQLLDKGVVGGNWTLRRQKVLFWTKQRIGILKVPDEIFEFEKNEQPLQIQWLPYAGQDIRQVSWLDEENSVLVYDQDKLLLVDVQSYGGFRAESLGQTASPFAYLEDLGRAYYLEPASHKLVSIQLLPSRERLPLPVLENRTSGELAPGRNP